MARGIRHRDRKLGRLRYDTLDEIARTAERIRDQLRTPPAPNHPTAVRVRRRRQRKNRPSNRPPVPGPVEVVAPAGRLTCARCHQAEVHSPGAVCDDCYDRHGPLHVVHTRRHTPGPLPRTPGHGLAADVCSLPRGAGVHQRRDLRPLLRRRQLTRVPQDPPSGAGCSHLLADLGRGELARIDAGSSPRTAPSRPVLVAVQVLDLWILRRSGCMYPARPPGSRAEPMRYGAQCPR